MTEFSLGIKGLTRESQEKETGLILCPLNSFTFNQQVWGEEKKEKALLLSYSLEKKYEEYSRKTGPEIKINS